MINVVSALLRNWIDDQATTNLKPTGLLVKTERKDYCSCRLELEFQERFDRRPFPEIERHRVGQKLRQHLQNANQTTFIVRASTPPDTLA
jgi:hypothetical protein